MNILLLGSGGREHALAWKLAASPLVERLFCAPGNAGIARDCELVALDTADHAAVIAFCEAKKIDLVVVGPEAPLCAGIVDDLTAAGIKAFGPSRAAAQLEGSKGFTKDLCRVNKIPTAAYERFNAAAAAKRYVRARGAPIVVKADGLAAGKGVVIANTLAEADAAVDMMFGGGLGAAGAEVVVEELLEGEEASFFALCDGETALALASAQDHKRAFDGDQGPNTGGMGAYSPAPVMTPEMVRRAMDEIVLPTVRAMKAGGAPYKGVLYAGLMITTEGPKLIEYAEEFRSALVPGRGLDRGDGGQGLSRRHRQGLGDRGTRGRGRGRGRRSLPRRHQGGRRPHPRQRRPRARRVRAGQDRGRGAGARVSGGRSDSLARGILPSRHRVSGGTTGIARKIESLNGARRRAARLCCFRATIFATPMSRGTWRRGR